MKLLLRRVLRLLITVTNALKRILDGLKNERLRETILQALPFWTASLITGLLAVFYAKIFAIAESSSLAFFRDHPLWFFIISPVCFVLAWWIVHTLAPFARGSGIPQVMAAVELATPATNEKISKLLSVKVIVVKIVSSIVMVLGGGAVGREGPTIQIAGSVFRVINEILPNWWPKISKKNMIMTGAAAGLAAAFNTPLGGIVFAVEELTKMHISYFKAAIFTAVILAGLTAQSILGSYLYLGFPNVTSLSRFVLVWVAIVAVVAGLSGGIMAKIMWKVLVWRQKMTSYRHHLFYLVLSSFIIVSLAYFVDNSIMGSGNALINSSLFSVNKYVQWYTPVFRILSPILSFTSGAAGGVFSPGLSAGASIGSFISSLLVLNESDTNLMILSGMVAFLTGITRAPFTSAILVLEMTDKNNLILYLMISGLIAGTVSLSVDKHSMYYYLKQRYLLSIYNDEPM